MGHEQLQADEDDAEGCIRGDDGDCRKQAEALDTRANTTPTAASTARPSP